MYDNIKLALLGGDARQGYLASMLSARGFECAVWGLGCNGCALGGAVRCRDWRCAVSGASAIILPLPASVDGVRVNCPGANDDLRADDDFRLRLTTLFDNISVPVFGGKIDEKIMSAAEKKGIRLVDYFDAETLRIRNAAPTAEGAVSLAMQRLPITLLGCNALVTGYGRIGTMLSFLLSRLGVNVTVAARSLEALAQASSMGLKTVKLSENAPCRGLSSVFETDLDIIFNTVPARLFDAQVLAKIPPKTLLIDLASVPGGVDFTAAKENGLEAHWALSLPGKYAPATAGKMIGETLLEYFESEGII